MQRAIRTAGALLFLCLHGLGTPAPVADTAPLVAQRSTQPSAGGNRHPLAQQRLMPAPAPDFASVRREAEAMAATQERDFRLHQVEIELQTPSLEIVRAEFHYFRPTPGAKSWEELKISVSTGIESDLQKWGGTVSGGRHAFDGPAPPPAPPSFLGPEEAIRRLGRGVPVPWWQQQETSQRGRPARPSDSPRLRFQLIQPGAGYWAGRTALDPSPPDPAAEAVFKETGPRGRWVWWTVIEHVQSRRYEYLYIDAATGRGTSHCVERPGRGGQGPLLPVSCAPPTASAATPAPATAGPVSGSRGPALAAPDASQAPGRDYATTRRAADEFVSKSHRGLPLHRVELDATPRGDGLDIHAASFYYLRRLSDSEVFRSPYREPIEWRMFEVQVRSQPGTHLLQVDKGDEYDVERAAGDPQPAAAPANALAPEEAVRRWRQAGPVAPADGGRLALYLLQAGVQRSPGTGPGRIGGPGRRSGGRQFQLGHAKPEFFDRTAPRGRWVWWTIVARDREPRRDEIVGKGGRIDESAYVYIDAVTGQVTAWCRGPRGPVACP